MEPKTGCTNRKAQALTYCPFWEEGECLVFLSEQVEHQLGYNRYSCLPPIAFNERFKNQSTPYDSGQINKMQLTPEERNDGCKNGMMEDWNVE